MDAHYIATKMKLFPKLNFVAKTIDVALFMSSGGVLECATTVPEQATIDGL